MPYLVHSTWCSAAFSCKSSRGQEWVPRVSVSPRCSPAPFPWRLICTNISLPQAEHPVGQKNPINWVEEMIKVPGVRSGWLQDWLDPGAETVTSGPPFTLSPSLSPFCGFPYVRRLSPGGSKMVHSNEGKIARLAHSNPVQKGISTLVPAGPRQVEAHSDWTSLEHLGHKLAPDPALWPCGPGTADCTE